MLLACVFALEPGGTLPEVGSPKTVLPGECMGSKRMKLSYLESSLVKVFFFLEK